MAAPPRLFEVHITAVRMLVVQATTDADAVAAAEQQLVAERRWLTRHQWKIRDVEPSAPFTAAPPAQARQEDTRAHP